MRVPLRHPLRARLMTTIQVDLPTRAATVVSADWFSGGNGVTVLVAPRCRHRQGPSVPHGVHGGPGGLGFSTLRFNFPYVEQGRKMPGPAAHAMSTWRAAVAFARAQEPGNSVWATGKSYGGTHGIDGHRGRSHRRRPGVPRLSAAPTGQAREATRGASAGHRGSAVVRRGHERPFHPGRSRSSKKRSRPVRMPESSGSRAAATPSR